VEKPLSVDRGEMMAWPFKKTNGRKASMALRLQHVRFRHVLENAQALMSLLDDGREKMGGDYILDRHYVESLLDTVTEKAGAVVFDACILAPEGGEALYDRFDAIKKQARQVLLAGDGEGEKAIDADLEPEYRLLSRVLEWIDGARTAAGETLMGFIRGVFDHIVLGCRESTDTIDRIETLTIISGGARNTIHLVDTDRILVARSAEDMPGGEESRRTLRLLLDGRDGAESSRADGAPEKTWLGVTGGRHLSLRRRGAGGVLRIEACPGAFADAGILFVYDGRGLNFADVLPASGFRVERSARGTLGWMYAKEAEEFENGVIQLGRHLRGKEA
jgi:hypothetical protein